MYSNLIILHSHVGNKKLNIIIQKINCLVPLLLDESLVKPINNITKSISRINKSINRCYIMDPSWISIDFKHFHRFNTSILFHQHIFLEVSLKRS